MIQPCYVAPGHGTVATGGQPGTAKWGRAHLSLEKRAAASEGGAPILWPTCPDLNPCCTLTRTPTHHTQNSMHGPYTLAHTCTHCTQAHVYTLYAQACTHHNTQLCACMHCTHMSTHHSTHTTAHMCAHTPVCNARTTIYTHSIAHMPPNTYMHAHSTAHNRARAHACHHTLTTVYMLRARTHHYMHRCTHTPLYVCGHTPTTTCIRTCSWGGRPVGGTTPGTRGRVPRQQPCRQRGRTPGEGEGAGPGLRALTLGDIHLGTLRWAHAEQGPWVTPRGLSICHRPGRSLQVHAVDTEQEQTEFGKKSGPPDNQSKSQPAWVGDTCRESSREGRGCGARPQRAWGHRGHVVSEGRYVLRRGRGAQVAGWEEGTGRTPREATGAPQGSRGG